MALSRENLVAELLREPQCLVRWGLPQWEQLVWQARSANLLGRVSEVVDEHGLRECVPQAPRAHLDAARIMAQAHGDAVRREVGFVRDALDATGVDIILLKGAGYAMAKLAAARGRMFADIDILVPRESLPSVESALMLNGWATTHHNRYDQHYYRRWMHELPPLRHNKRSTVLDVHHGILPLTARVRPDASRLRAASRTIGADPRLRVLAPTDMVLHSAAHLFYNETYEQGLRDLVDLDLLLRDFGARPDFWSELTARAAELGLGRACYYALRFARRILDTPVPAQAEDASRAGEPVPIVRRLMDSFLFRVLEPDHPSTADWLTPIARRALYLRAHWLRMPPGLLAMHLTVKAFRKDEQPAG